MFSIRASCFRHFRKPALIAKVTSHIAVKSFSETYLQGFAMKVEGTSPTTTPLTKASTGQASARPQSPAGESGRNDVSISEKSSQLQALELSMKDVPEIDSSKIEAIRQAISDGNFSISSGRVAEKMMAYTREIMAQKKA
jgi:negative regulator of flagellin synthesis FlgM